MKKCTLLFLSLFIAAVALWSGAALADTPRQNTWWHYFKVEKEQPRPATTGPVPGPVTGPPPTPGSHEGLRWNAYGPGMEEAKKIGKTVYLNFYGDWCHFCKKMDAETYSDKTVSHYLEDNFVLIKVNGDQAKELAKKFVVRGYPTGFFIDDKGKTIGMVPGYWPPDQFLHVLKFINTKAYENMTFDEYVAKVGK